PYCYTADNPVVLKDPNGMDWYEVENKETQEKEIKWTDYKSQAEMNENKIDGKYLGEAVVIFKGSKDEKLDEDGKLTGEGANPANVTIYGINGPDDINTYNGMTIPKSNDYSTIDEGEYKAFYQDMATSLYGTAGAKAKGIPPAYTYRIKSLDGTEPKGTRNGKNVTMEGVFLHRTDWNGKATNSSMGCLIIDGRDWRDVEKQLKKSSNIFIRITR
ncbi:MAG: hypothetical protein QMD02_04550, partial [Bacteroidales bacterium]|nr:hypothetical protein [Bacteroidales bacterium]